MAQVQPSEQRWKKIRLTTVAEGVGVLAAHILLTSLAITYFAPRSAAWAETFAKRSPFPIALVGYREAIAYRELSSNMASIRNFYEQQDFSQIGLRVDFSTEDGQKRFRVREKEVLNKMIEDASLRILARRAGITVDREAADEGLSRKLEEYQSRENVEQELQRLYGWTLNDFREKVVIPSLYEAKLRERFEEEERPDMRGQDRIKEARAALKSGKDFAAVAREFSEGQTAAEGGELGWFRIEDLAQELRDPIRAQKIKVPGDIVESGLGYHIILVEETKKEKDVPLYRLKQIFTKKQLFPNWFSERMKTLQIYVLSPEYRWDAETARVEFRDEQMIKFERELLEKASGDAAFFF